MIPKLAALQKELPGITVSISLSDLEQWGKGLVEQTRKQLEQQINDAKAETYPSENKVCEILEVTRQTLWRWRRSGYLVPIEVGGKRRYRMSDIQKILNNGKS